MKLGGIEVSCSYSDQQQTYDNNKHQYTNSHYNAQESRIAVQLYSSIGRWPYFGFFNFFHYEGSLFCQRKESKNDFYTLVRFNQTRRHPFKVKYHFLSEGFCREVQFQWNYTSCNN